MSRESWSADLGVGVPEMDAEHELQIGLVRALEDALESGSREECGRLLEQLQDYTQVHFAAEALLMRLHSYPGYAEHELEHGNLLDQLEDVRRAWDGGEGPPAKELLTGLRHWLTEHVQTFDRALALHLAKEGVTPP